MKAMLLPRYGEPDVFEYGDAPDPSLGPHDVLVRSRASSVNPFDCYMRSGAMRQWLRLKMPAVLGVDVAGEVVKVGSAVTRFRVGDRVYAYLDLTEGTGGYGELVVVPESVAARMPRNVTFEEAGVIPGVALTAYETFYVHAPLRQGMRVLINGASGGVGTFAVQIAKALGAHVTGVCSAAKAAHVRRLGADRIIDYTEKNVLEIDDRFDVILHGVRNGEHHKMRRLLKPQGVLVVITGTPLTALAARLLNPLSSQRTVAFVVKHDGENLGGVTRLIESNQVRPVVERVFSWRELAEAHRRVETGRVTGKIAIRIESEGPASSTIGASDKM